MYSLLIGPKLYKEPSAKSNKHIIQNALSHCCMAGKVNEAQKNKILEVTDFLKETCFYCYCLHYSPFLYFCFLFIFHAFFLLAGNGKIRGHQFPGSISRHWLPVPVSVYVLPWSRGEHQASRRRPKEHLPQNDWVLVQVQLWQETVQPNTRKDYVRQCGRDHHPWPLMADQEAWNAQKSCACQVLVQYISCHILFHSLLPFLFIECLPSILHFTVHTTQLTVALAIPVLFL